MANFKARLRPERGGCPLGKSPLLPLVGDSRICERLTPRPLTRSCTVSIRPRSPRRSLRAASALQRTPATSCLIRSPGRARRVDAHTTKNDEGRSFPFTADLEKIVTEQLEIHEKLKAAGTICPFVFHRNGERIGYFRSAWWNACNAAGCPDALVHDMRRSAVRTFERAGVPRSVAMSIVGHKTESIYRRYAIVDEAMQREAAARLDAWMAAAPAAPSTATVTPLRQDDRRRGRVSG